MSFSFSHCWHCGPAYGDYVGLAILAALVVLPLFAASRAAARRELARREAEGWCGLAVVDPNRE